MVPMTKRQGYDDAFSVNVTITSSTQGIVIPPSHNAVIYSYAAGGTVSIASGGVLRVLGSPDEHDGGGVASPRHFPPWRQARSELDACGV